MPGPQRKPTKQLELAGSWRAAERKKSEPQIGFAIPDPPPFLSRVGLKYWAYVCEVVGPLRCTTAADAVQLGIMADALAEIAACDVLIKKEGASICSEKGGLYTNPACNRRAGALTRLQAGLDRCGMNPANRSKVVELSPKLAEVVEIEQKKSRYSDD
jgi:P27 family predicted phage terminase small subunit